MEILLLLSEDNKSGEVVGEDGSIVGLHHNGEYMLSTYSREKLFFGMKEDIWEYLAEGKQFINDWEGVEEITMTIILDAIGDFYSGQGYTITIKHIINDGQDQILDWL